MAGPRFLGHPLPYQELEQMHAHTKFFHARVNCGGHGCGGNSLHLLACEHRWCRWMKSTLQALGSGQKPTWPTNMSEVARYNFLELVRLRAREYHIPVSDLSVLLAEMPVETRAEMSNALIHALSYTTASTTSIGGWPDHMPYRNPRPHEPIHIYNPSAPHEFMAFRAPSLRIPATPRLARVLPANILTERIEPPQLPLRLNHAAFFLDQPSCTAASSTRYHRVSISPSNLRTYHLGKALKSPVSEMRPSSTSASRTYSSLPSRVAHLSSQSMSSRTSNFRKMPSHGNQHSKRLRVEVATPQ